MYNYSTVSEAVSSLVSRGYTCDLNTQAGRISMRSFLAGNALLPDEFLIDEVHRFEGMTDPGDEMILYAISSVCKKVRGIFLSAYGMYEEKSVSEIVQNLLINPPPSIKGT